LYDMVLIQTQHNETMFEISSGLFSSDMQKWNNAKDELPEIKDESILLIEDDYVNYLYLKDLLSGIGVNLIRAIDLKQALRSLTVSINIKIILLSASITENISDKEFEFLRRRYAYLPLILIIPKNYESAGINSLKSKCDSCINLPTDRSYIIEAIQEFVSVAYLPNIFKY
jgi:vacuolar-type H+-ATPase subunit F/Vma7